MRHHGVLALRDVTLPPAALPLAAAAFACIGWPGPPSWPPSDAFAAAGGAAASLLASAGFTAWPRH